MGFHFTLDISLKKCIGAFLFSKLALKENIIFGLKKVGFKLTNNSN